MPRTIGLVAFVLCAAAAFAAAMAQPAAVDGCDRQAVEEMLVAGGIPNFRGCPVKYAHSRMRATFGDTYQVQLLEDRDAAGFRSGTVTRQIREGRQVQLYYAARPAPAEAAAPAPPPLAVVGPPRPAPPPPPPPPPPAAVIPAAAPGAAVNPDRPPVEVYQNVSFSILDAAPVEAGKILIFRVNREGDDGRVHQVNLSYSGGGLLVDPPQFIRFEPGDPSQKDLEVRTAAAQPGDGDNTVQVLLQPADDGSFIGVPRAASGIITETPPPPTVVSYGIAADGSFSRGNDLLFTVSRTGPLVPLSYRIGSHRRVRPPLSTKFPIASISPKAWRACP